MDVDPRQLAGSDDGVTRPSGPADEWVWSKRRPAVWRPNVRTGQDRIRVAFHTFSGHYGQVVHRFLDTYACEPGDYRCRTRHYVLGQAPGGYCF